jgi:hypothetical protein
VGQAVAAVAGDLDIDDSVLAVGLEVFDGEPAVSQGVGGGVGIELRPGKEIPEPFHAGFHAILVRCLQPVRLSGRVGG